MNFRYVVFLVLSVLLLSGCIGSDDEVNEFNKPAFYWYKQIAKSISDEKMDNADAYYISLKSEHARSPLMSTSILMLANAHMQQEKYLLASYYLDEYNKRYGENDRYDYIEFMKLKASFSGIKDVNKDQKLVIDSINQAKKFVYRYPGSQYTGMVNTMLIRLHMSQYLLNENIAALYDRTSKPNAAKIYRSKNTDSLVEMSDIRPPKEGIIGRIFN